jgi:hypothetical protein
MGGDTRETEAVFWCPQEKDDRQRILYPTVRDAAVPHSQGQQGDRLFQLPRQTEGVSGQNGSQGSQTQKEKDGDSMELEHRFAALLHQPPPRIVDERGSALAASPLKPSTRANVPSREALLSAKELLRRRLALYGLEEYQVDGDGACQFASLADQLLQDVGQAGTLRKHAVEQLRACPEFYVEFVDAEREGSYLRYCERMSLSRSWGDHLTLQAVSDRLNIVINLITSYPDTPHVEVLPRGHSSPPKRHVWLSFFGEVHYNSLYTIGHIKKHKSQNDCAVC